MKDTGNEGNDYLFAACNEKNMEDMCNGFNDYLFAACNVK